MITPDGDRSKKRLWFGKKQLQIIKDIDVPAKAVKWDGFTFKVWQQGELSGGRVTAPMGAVVAMAHQSGNENPLQISVADYWAGAFTSLAQFNSIYYDAPGNLPIVKVFDMPSEEDMVLDGNSIVPFVSAGSLSDYGLPDGDPSNWNEPGVVSVRDYSPIPGIMPYKGAEGFLFSVTDNAFIDFNLSGYPDFPKYILESSVLFYSSNGSNLSGRRTCALQVGEADEMAGVPQPLRPLLQLTADWQYTFQNEWYETDGDWMAGRNFQHPNTWPIYLKDLIPAGTMPDELRAILLDDTVYTVRPQGSYSFVLNGVQTILHVVDVTNWRGTPGYPTDDYFDDHPEHEQWKIFYVIQTGNSISVINSDQFIGLLRSLASIDI